MLNRTGAPGGFLSSDQSGARSGLQSGLGRPLQADLDLLVRLDHRLLALGAAGHRRTDSAADQGAALGVFPEDRAEQGTAHRAAADAPALLAGAAGGQLGEAGADRRRMTIRSDDAVEPERQGAAGFLEPLLGALDIAHVALDRAARRKH